MSKVKILVGAFIALLAVSAVASAPASAEGWMVNGAELSGSTNLANTAAIVGGKYTVKGGGVTVTCTASTVKGANPKLESPMGGSAESLEFTGCVAPAPCALTTSTIKTVPIAVLVLGLSHFPWVHVRVRPKTGTLFTNVAFTSGGTCAFKGKTPVTGEVLAENEKGEEENTWQKVKSLATEESGELKLGSSAATLEGSPELKLENSEPWSFLG